MGKTSPPGQSLLRSTPIEQLHDLVCVGFGPASLAIATALHDKLSALSNEEPSSSSKVQFPKVAFLERQPRFAWHAGMLVPGATMQITFIKDLATLRNPKSDFTFLNYLHSRQRLVHFANLGTFLPLRLEYEDYLRWCADWFAEVVHYNQEVLDIIPEDSLSTNGTINSFLIRSRESVTGAINTYRARHVVISVGGKPNMPHSLPLNHPRIIHSSAYAQFDPRILKENQNPPSFAIIGSGQSAAEIFNDLRSRYPYAKTSWIIRGAALRPSDDSPFVNEIFNPQHTDTIYSQSPVTREEAITKDKGTNYGVVRLELLERIYSTIYEQRIKNPDEESWRYRILPSRFVTHAEDVSGQDRIELKVRNESHVYGERCESKEEIFEVDAVFAATGYTRKVHEEMLRPAEGLMPDRTNVKEKWRVSRDYRVEFKPGAVSTDAGIWLQGCNESTHGLSDTLLSVLATRGGEMVESIFGKSLMLPPSNGETALA